MKSSITLLLFLSSMSFAYTQTNLDKAFTAFNLYYVQNAGEYPVQNSREKLLLNKSEKIIDLGELQMPINEVNVRYYSDNETNKNYVNFSCIGDINCFISNVTQEKYYVGTSGLMIPFKTKEKCYKWIELFSKVKEEINK